MWSVLGWSGGSWFLLVGGREGHGEQSSAVPGADPELDPAAAEQEWPLTGRAGRASSDQVTGDRRPKT